ncbi:MAG: sigma-70 family RNA polymerase sigma factor [Bacteroidales bacterium]|nr:sigma-70 family RNA polymerase sigma factor [Bacteroidales bacterium]
MKIENRSQHPFLTLLDQHHRAIDKLCWAFARGNEMDYEDLRQDAIVNLWVGWKNYKPLCQSVTWVWRIVLNTCISWQRRNRRYQSINSISYADYSDDSTETYLHQELSELIALLPEKDQQLLALYMDGWKLQEIAQMLSTTETNIQTRIYRIKKQINRLSNE